MSDGDIHIKHYWFNIMVCVSVLSIVALFGLSLYVHGEQRNVDGYVLGCQAERMRNPSREYIESGVSFCWDSGNFYNVKPSRGGFRITK